MELFKSFSMNQAEIFKHTLFIAGIFYFLFFTLLYKKKKINLKTLTIATFILTIIITTIYLLNNNLNANTNTGISIIIAASISDFINMLYKYNDELENEDYNNKEGNNK